MTNYRSKSSGEDTDNEIAGLFSNDFLVRSEDSKANDVMQHLINLTSNSKREITYPDINYEQDSFVRTRSALKSVNYLREGDMFVVAARDPTDSEDNNVLFLLSTKIIVCRVAELPSGAKAPLFFDILGTIPGKGPRGNEGLSVTEGSTVYINSAPDHLLVPIGRTLEVLIAKFSCPNILKNNKNSGNENFDTDKDGEFPVDRRKFNRGASQRRSYSREEKLTVIRMKDAGHSYEDISVQLGVSKVNIEKWCSLKGRHKILNQIAKFEQSINNQNFDQSQKVGITDKYSPVVRDIGRKSGQLNEIDSGSRALLTLSETAAGLPSAVNYHPVSDQAIMTSSSTNTSEGLNMEVPKLKESNIVARSVTEEASYDAAVRGGSVSQVRMTISDAMLRSWSDSGAMMSSMTQSTRPILANTKILSAKRSRTKRASPSYRENLSGKKRSSSQLAVDQESDEANNPEEDDTILRMLGE